jgi:hypothetical protein
VVTVYELLAENNFGDTRSGGLAGPTGLVIVLLLVVGTVLLIRTMNARLRRLPSSFEPPPGDAAAAPTSPGPSISPGSSVPTSPAPAPRPEEPER